MSSVPEKATGNVQSMAEFLEEAYRFIRRADRFIHTGLKHIEGRLYALRLAEDEEYQERREEIQKLIDSDSLPSDAATFDEVASRYGAGPRPE